MKHMRKVFGSILLIMYVFFTASIFCEGFIAGTLVKTPGQYIPIEEIQIGDLVCCCDFSEGCNVSKITALSCGEISPLIKLHFKEETIVCAPDQLFYLGDSIGWRKAQDLKVGDCVASSAGNDVLVQKIEILDDRQLVYDITVEDHHNFYVSESELLAHNMMVVLAAPAAAPVISSAVVVAAVKTATAANFIAGFVYSLFWSTDVKKHTQPPNTNANGGGNNEKCECGHYCNALCGCRCTSCGCSDKDDKWKKNTISKQEFFKRTEVSKNYEHVRDGVYQLKKGAVPLVKDAYYLQWDNLHSDVEIYSKGRKHSGSLDPQTLKLYKNPVFGRDFPLK